MNRLTWWQLLIAIYVPCIAYALVLAAVNDWIMTARAERIKMNALAVQPIDLNGIISIGNQLANAVGAAVPRLMSIAYFAAVVVLLFRLFKAWRSPGGVDNITLIGAIIAFALAGK